MDPAGVAQRFDLDRRKRAVVRVLCLAILAATLLPSVALSQSQTDQPTVESVRILPQPDPLLIRPRVFLAYGALIAAAMLSLLYLYRGRAFIVYWIGAWLLVAAALALVARDYDNRTLAAVVMGMAMLCIVWAAGLTLLAAEAFPQNALRWSSWRVNAVGASALWFLAGPLVLPVGVVINTAALATGGLLGWSAVRYLRLARQTRSAGALIVGAGLSLIALSHFVIILVADVSSDLFIARIAVVNVVTTMFVALGTHLLAFEEMTAELRASNRKLGIANEKVRRLAITDSLTGCHNRRFFDEIERREMQRIRRYGSPLSVVFIDVNHFKQLNDTLGHDRGDELLRAIGALLQRTVRESDYVIRWGGDEFLLLLSCSESEALAKAANLRAAFEQERINAGLPDYIGLSVGVAPASTGADTLRHAIREADSRMYGDKLSDRPAPGTRSRRKPGTLSR